jgi:hypothetical protein
MNHKQVKQKRGAPVKKDSDREIETIIEQVWHDLQGQVSRTDILRVNLCPSLYSSGGGGNAASRVGRGHTRQSCPHAK